MELNENGQIIIDVVDLIKSDAVMKQCARHAVFEKEIFNGLVQILIKDEADFEDGHAPWWCAVSFGKSYFEEARIKVLQNLGSMEITQIECLKREVENYKQLYAEYLSKSVNQQNYINSLECENKTLRDMTK